MKIMDYFLTESQVADALGVNRNTITRWARQGKLDIQRIGMTGLIPKWQVEILRFSRKRKIHRSNNERAKDIV